MIGDPKRTRMYGEVESAQHEQTVPGMAHFAGTGPAGMACFQCHHWNSGDLLTTGRLANGWLKAHPCGLFKKLTELDGPAVSPSASACRHFEKSGFALSLHIDPTKAKP